MSHAATPLLLNYTQAQRRWDRNIFYLLSLICISQLFQAPAPILQWLERLTSPVIVFWHPFRWWSPAERFSQFAQLIASSIVLPLTGLLIALAAFLLLFQVRRARTALLIVALLQMLVVPWVLAAIAYEFYAYPERWMFYTAYSNTDPFNDPGPGDWLQYFVCLVYPPLLLLAVTGPSYHRFAPESPRPPRAAWAWRITAAACILYAAPTLFLWCTNFSMRAAWLTRHVFSFYLGEGWNNSLRGIGELAETFACASVIPLLLYARLKGPIGRQALLICAALLAVAAAVPLAAFIPSLTHLRLGAPLSPRSLETFQYPAALFSRLTLALTFPLSLRIALSLSGLDQIFASRPPPITDPQASDGVPPHSRQ